jgi:curved DNA-binding protein CbpA
MSGTTPEPIAQGDLAKTPFAHVLLHLHHKQMSGTLVLWPTAPGAQGQDRLLFVEGWPVMGRLVDRAAALDRGMLPLFARKDGPYAFYAEDLVGEAPLKGRVDPLMVLAASLRGSARDEIIGAYISALGDASQVRFKPGVDLKRYQLQPKEAGFVDVIRAAPATVAELLEQCELGPAMGRRLLYLLFITRALERFDPASAPSPRAVTAPAPAAAPTAETGGFDLPLPDMPLPEAPPDPTPPAAAAPAPAPSVPVAAARAPVGAPPRPGSPAGPPHGGPSLGGAGAQRFKAASPVPPPAPAGLSPDATAFWNEVIARCQAIDTQDYYKMLEVPRDAGVDLVRKQYFALAKRWHPDRAIGELAPLRPFVEQCFALFTTAQETLSDEKKRGVYLRQVQEGGGTPQADRKLEAILWAAKEHQKAEILIRQRNCEAAASLLSAAIEVVDDEPDLLASYGWCLYNLPHSDGRISEMLTAVDRALAIEPKHDRAQYYKGMILTRAGKDAEAAVAFRKALELNPKNTDAQREVRLLDMRGKSGTTGKSTASKAPPPGRPDDKKGDAGGFLSKLFGSNKKS